MAYYLIEWTDTFLEKIADHGITPEEVEDVILDPDEKDVSDSSGRPLWSGWTRYGTWVSVVFVWSDRDTIRPITAFSPEED